MKLIIAGSRTFDDYEDMVDVLNRVKQLHDITQVVCGTAKGADTLGKRWARENNVPVKDFPADWQTYGKSAGHVRNWDMGEYANVAVIFIENSSRGSLHMWNVMKELSKPVYVSIYNEYGKDWDSFTTPEQVFDKRFTSLGGSIKHASV